MAKRKEYRMFIGRYQPFHAGHQTIINKVLKGERKNVFIAVRDTELSKSNPYTAEYRIAMIRKAYPLKKYGDRVIIKKIPDVVEVCYGRGVGWGMREIKVPKKVANISATKIRKARGI